MQLESLEDAALVARTQEGNREAFSTLVVRYQDRVVNLVYRRLNDREAALDVAQEIFLKAYRGLDRFQGQSKFFTWLFRITMNETISARRKRGRRQPLSRRRLRRPFARAWIQVPLQVRAVLSLLAAGAAGADHRGGVGESAREPWARSAASNTNT